jgi:hypothetical protein
MTTVRLPSSSRYIGYFDICAILPICGVCGQEYNINFVILSFFLFTFKKKATGVFFWSWGEQG